MAYRKRCANIQIDLFDIPKIFVVGQKAIAEGVDDARLGDIIYEFVQTIRKDT